MQVYHNISWNTHFQLLHENNLFDCSLVIVVYWHGGLLSTDFFSLLFLKYVEDVVGIFSLTYRVSHKKLYIVWRAVATLNFEIGIKVGGVLESSILSFKMHIIAFL